MWVLRCVLHADFWLRYARYLEPKDVPAAKDAVRRGQLIHCKGISEMQLFGARFHERHGDISDARAAYGLVLGRLAPGLISAVQAAANFERRQVKSHQIPDSTSSAPLTAVLAWLCPCSHILGCCDTRSQLSCRVMSGYLQSVAETIQCNLQRDNLGRIAPASTWHCSKASARP